MEVLLRLPEAIVKSLFTYWLDVKDIGKLDAAYCVHSHRDIFLHTIRSSDCTLEMPIVKEEAYESPVHYENLDQFLYWALKRDICLTSLLITKSFETDYNLRQKLLQRSGLYIKKLQYFKYFSRWTCKQTTMDIVKFCKNIEDVNFRGFSNNPREDQYLLREISNQTFTIVTKECKKIKRINLALASVSDAGLLRILQETQGIQQLNLNNCWDKLTAGFRTLARYSATLLSLDLTQCDLTDVVAGAIVKNAGQLRTIVLDQNYYITGNTVTALAEHCPLVEHVSLNNCSRVSNQSLSTLAKHCSQLKAIELCRVDTLTDESLVGIAAHAYLLETLVLMDCDRVGDEGIIAIARGCPHLRTIEMPYCRKITDDALRALGEHCNRLRSLTVNACTLLTDVGLAGAIPYWPDLTMLYAEHCPSIGAQTLFALAEACPSLQNLVLNYCAGVTGEGITALAHSCPDLRRLQLYRCEGVTASSIQAVAQYCRRIRYIHASVECALPAGLFKPKVSLITVRVDSKKAVEGETKLENCLAPRMEYLSAPDELSAYWVRGVVGQCGTSLEANSRAQREAELIESNQQEETVLEEGEQVGDQRGFQWSEHDESTTAEEEGIVKDMKVPIVKNPNVLHKK